ncbi:hypothetical protein CGZ93_03350 [Enemella dayhoffiae]|uniref:LGFP repeat-containing protein n=1 Tax=Enemella dayhoffiae TaxID=2016507 RepID=A0A255HAE5_9ACTN|nr:hypothetical protein [Enemella dayhoffiae]OYO24442.1 hypothetical protein CGZ93_03350 [Enemella dayhoffiae]
MGIDRDALRHAINDYRWQVILGSHIPPDGSWAPWIDDSKPFPDRHDLFDYLRYETFDPTCQPYGEIARVWASRPELGKPWGCEVNASAPGARVQDFAGGRICWSPETGAQVVVGAILNGLTRAGGEWDFGLPVGSEFCGLRDRGCAQIFQRGLTYFSPASGAHGVRGAIFNKFAELGYERSALGYPLARENCGMKDEGCYQTFQGGLIYWSPATGAHVLKGAIFDKFGALGWERSFLGYPTSDEICGLRDGGCVQRFQGGLLYWSPAAGPHFVRGLIQQRYAAMGWETGAFGFPVTDEVCGLRDGGCYQRFQREDGHIYFSPASGAWSVQGAIFGHWASTGWEAGRLGYPVGPESCRDLPDARECVQNFQGGEVVWNSRFGTRG